MRTDEQFIEAVRERGAQKKNARKTIRRKVLLSGIPLLLCGVILAAWWLRPAPQTPLPENDLSSYTEENKVISSSEHCLAAPEMVLVEVCSPDEQEIYCSFTEREDIYALIGAQPDVNDAPEEIIAKAEEKKSASSTTKNETKDELKSKSFFSFLVRYTDAEGKINRFLVTEDASLYSLELYQQGWTMALPETATALIEQLKELGWEAP